MTKPDPLNGRYAPSPTGRLHLGNLRTAMVAWLFSRTTGGSFHLRFEDLDSDAVRSEHYQTQTEDLLALGLDWDGDAICQRDRVDIYRALIQKWVERDLVYPCYCSRREVREATQAPNGPWSHGQYPGTCRSLTNAQRSERDRSGRPPALRVRSGEPTLGFDDVLCGHHEGLVDDFVVQRGDGTPAYNMVVVVDDAAEDINFVVRADDLLDSTPRQLFIANMIDAAIPTYAHVPLVLNRAGDRLAKRDGAVTLQDRRDLGQQPNEVLSILAASLGLCEAGEAVTPADLVDRFDPSSLPNNAWRLDPDEL